MKEIVPRYSGIKRLGEIWSRGGEPPAYQEVFEAKN